MSTCFNNQGSFSCTCPYGFFGDGRISGNGCTGITVLLVIFLLSEILFEVCCHAVLCIGVTQLLVERQDSN